MISQVALMVLQIALAIGVPALIAFFVPRRARHWTLALWIFAPLLILFAVGASEIASGRSSSADLDKLIYGILLIGSFLALPWLFACGFGYALGALVRRTLRPEAPRAPPPADPVPAMVAKAPEPAPTAAPYAPPPADPDAPTLAPPGGWQAAHVGFENDDLEIDGLPIWSLPWRPEPGVVTLAHPAHPGQLHRFDIYSVDDGMRATRFAAAELSNGVWGFYHWEVPRDARQGLSADGSLRYEHQQELVDHGLYDRDPPVARLYDSASGALLFDGDAWASSRIVPQPDGALLLALAHAEWQTIFRIDPETRSFRNLATPADERPLVELAAAAALARAQIDDPANAYLGRQVAPDGSLLVVLQAVEWSNTHWVRSPQVVEVTSHRVLLDLHGTDWDAVVSFPRGRTVHLSFRRHHFGGGAEVEIELDGERYILFEHGGATFGPLADLPSALEAASQRAAAEAPRPPVGRRRTTPRSVLVALLILVGALAAIAIGTLTTLALQGEPPAQKLDKIPPMPSRTMAPHFGPRTDSEPSDRHFNDAFARKLGGRRSEGLDSIPL